MCFGPSVVGVTAIAHPSFALGHAPKPHKLQGEQRYKHDVQANKHARALGHSLYARMADAPRTRQKEQDGENEECRTKPRVDLVAPLACGGVRLGAEAGKPDEPENTEGEEEEGDERRVMHGWRVIVCRR